MSKIGFIGLGVMGRPMAGHLQNRGHELYVLKHRSPLPSEVMDAGAIACTSPRVVAEKSETIITMLPDTPQVESVLFGGNGVIEGLTPGKLVIDMSSISPTSTKHFAKRINQVGCDYLDAPVSGGEVGAKAATLTIMVGGDDDVFEQALPLFDLLGRNVNLIGSNGAGQTAKVANQIIVALTIEAVGEALLFASKAGVNPAKVREALIGGFAGSKILEVHGARMINRDFDPGFRVGLHQKDLGLALEGARELGLSLPNTASTQELFNACDKTLDHSALITVLEKLGTHCINEE
ncbi:MAG: 2-hydroxy-3-oxopropionate reductase [Candidatus Thiodiazotropha sp. (ex Monitilora ramsayi)]|nr:2-hydroxy-3-oxopropionate reductase [Candidatus Thiodiazotropha sp. (ex Monitilora ramsayi)]